MRPGRSIFAAILLSWAVLLPAQQPGSKIWQYPPSDRPPLGRISSSPALGMDGTIYFGAGFTLVALQPEGILKWSFATKGTVFSSPAAGADGTLYFGSNDGRLYAVAPNGKQKWSFNAGGCVYSSPSLDAEGNIYFGCDDNHLYAVTTNGVKKWSFATSGSVRGSPSIGADGVIYVGSWDKQLYAIAPSGNQLWAFETGHYVYSSPAIGADGTIYFGSVDGKLYALKPDGKKKWEFATDGHLYSSPCIGSDGTIYVGSWDNRLYAVTPTGSFKWALTTGALVQSSPAVAADGTVYVGSDEKKLYAVTTSEGTNAVKRWVFVTSSLVRSSPVIATNGTIYFGTEEGRLYAVRGSAPLAATSWPMFRSSPSHKARTLLVISTQPTNQQVVVSNSASFSVTVTGPGPLIYQWKQNGAKVTFGTNATLTITNSQSSHSGKYTVEISNDQEVLTSLPANLTVVVPPVILSPPQSQTLTVGSDVIFQVAASSAGALSYQWCFNGTNLPGATGPMLVLTDIQLKSMGKYTMVVTNAAGTATSEPAVLNVVTAPVITAQPQNQVAAITRSASFKVEVVSHAPVSYQWRMNDTNIPAAVSASFTLTNLQPSQSGNYSVVVSNMAGMVISTPAALSVALPPLITVPLKSQVVVAGGNASFNVKATSVGPLAYQWFFSEQAISNATAASFVLSNVHFRHAGPYRVVVTNVAGSVTSSPAQLTVRMPPSILMQPQNQVGALGGDVVLKVGARGSPPLVYQWLCNGTNITEATNSSLTLGPIIPAMAGNYVVIVSNAVGFITSQPAQLIIPPKPGLWQRFKAWF